MRFELARQAVHLSGLLFVIVAQFVRKEIAVTYFLLIALFFFVYSWYVRTQEKKIASLLGKLEARFRDFTLGFERKNANPFTGAMFFYLGCAIAFALFPLPFASAACAMLAIGDALSTVVGVNFGKHKICGKTLEGTIACFFGSLVGGIFFVNIYLAVTGAFFASLAELVPKIDDNLTIPVFSGLAMLLVSLAF